jgi:hypothetical protein
MFDFLFAEPSTKKIASLLSFHILQYQFWVLKDRMPTIQELETFFTIFFLSIELGGHVVFGGVLKKEARDGIQGMFDSDNINGCRNINGYQNTNDEIEIVHCRKQLQDLSRQFYSEYTKIQEKIKNIK